MEKTITNLVTEHLDIWTTAIEQKSSAGRGSSKKFSLYGIKKLRELILELAVRGKLVAQDPNDEPAAVLLERIAAEKAQLVKEGKLKKQKTLPEIGEEEKPFELPNGWEWEFFGDICEIERGGSPRPIKAFLTEEPNGLNWIKIGDTEIGGKYVTKAAEKIRPEGLAKTRQVFPGDFLLTNSMSFGRPYITQIEGCIHDGWLRISPPKSIDKDYLFNLLSSPFIIRSFKKSAAGAVVMNLNADKVKETMVAVPPSKEQHRIVAKVDELMSLCDALEAQTEDSITAHQTLVTVLLDALLIPKTGSPELAESFTQNWQRLHDHFDTLFTTVASIDALKQTILQLAVMGKLVKQDPNDEPAAKLLERIAKEKAQLINEGKIKKHKPLPPIRDEEKPFELPNGWEWCRLGDLALTSEAGWSPMCLPTQRDKNKWAVLKVSAVTWGIYKPDENKELPSSLEPREQYEVQDGDFLISRANTADLVAKAVVVPTGSPKKLMMSDKVIRFQFHNVIDGEYINLYNNAKFSREYYASVAGGTSSSMKNVSREQIRSLLVAFPPISEQQKITTIQGQLFKMCEQLKSRLNAAQQTQLQLTDALVEHAVS